MRKILIVDDQAEVREILEATLQRADYAVLKCSSAQEALSLIRSDKPVLVIMDIMMPGQIDGIEATRIIKSDPETKKCKVMVVTGKIAAKDEETAFAAGADCYLAKPFSPLKLLREVDKLLA